MKTPSKVLQILTDNNIEFTTEEFNSNNGWGFGGAYGHRIHFEYKGKNYQITDATACYRHAPSERFTRMTIEWDGRTTLFDCRPSRGIEKLTAFFAQN